MGFDTIEINLVQNINHKKLENFKKYCCYLLEAHGCFNRLLYCFRACSLPELSEDVSQEVTDGSVGYYCDDVAERDQS